MSYSSFEIWRIGLDFKVAEFDWFRAVFALAKESPSTLSWLLKQSLEVCRPATPLTLPAESEWEAKLEESELRLSDNDAWNHSEQHWMAQ